MTQDMRARADLPGPSRVGANGDAPPTLDPRRWLALTVVLVAGFMALLDVTIVNVAIPTILRDRGPSTRRSNGSWPATCLGPRRS